MSEKRQRSLNYGLEDILKLIALIQEYKRVVENKKTDAVSCNEKNKAWEKICGIYNAQTTSQRTPEQLRQKFDSLKKETRKYYAQIRQQRLKTGGGDGGPHVEHKLEIVYNKIRDIIKLSTEGHKSHFDSDAMFLESSTNEDIEIDLVDNSKNRNTQLQMCDAGIPLVMETDTMDLTWQRSPVQILRSQLDVNLDVSGSSNLKSPERNLQLPTKETNDGAATSEGLPSTQVPGHQLGPSRRKRTKGQQSVPLSATARHLNPWVTAKHDLVELQMELLRKEHDAAQRREEEKKKREEELFQLQKESLELEIRIRKETLKKLISE